MSSCPSCGGVLGRDCFNPQECAWIGQQEEMAAQHSAEEAHHSIQQLKAEIAALAERIESSARVGDVMQPLEIFRELRQLSAV